VIHVYAFVDELDELPAAGGVAGAPLELLCAAGLTAVVSRLDAEAAADGPEAALAHGLVVEALLDTAAAVLPVRFGERFADPAAFAVATGERTQQLREALDHVRGCAEIGVRVAPSARRDAETGTEYLRGRLADTRQLDALGDRLRPFARGSAESVGGEVAYLVPRADAAAALDAVQAFADERPGLAVSCTGPWAPYSFAGGAR
jgi:hypothetical protein